MSTETAPATDHVDTAHDDHPPHLQHHFVSSEQQFDSAKLGMWLFLVTEILLFSALFVAYAVYRNWNPVAFVEASATLDWQLGFVNTLVLLTSSFTVALSIHYIQKNDVQKSVISLLSTLALAGVFLVVKYFEYMAKFEVGIFPGEAFNPTGSYEYLAAIQYVPQFFSIYFVMTGIHGVHVLIGMGLIAWMASRAYRGHFSDEYYTPIELTGLYWHIVDIVWIFLFPLLYLV
ncbi:MAG: cytochrome c oxidase subunit 3 family protein [Longimonas sp.]|uniref:cytochrome c oxidase subunit 3 family protein n=1 Tax=Longimonas sp. TaxID=2039626 RepID=UPI00335E8DEC